MTFPNETLPKGRRQRTTSLYDRLVAKGAVMDQAFGLEHALWFANDPVDAHEEPSFHRSRAHDYVAREVQAVREAVGCIEIANYAKHRIVGSGARTWLDQVLPAKLPKPGRIALTPLLTPKGRLYGDLTVACLADDEFWLFGSGSMQAAHSRWFEARLETGLDVRYANLSSDWHGLALSGPNSRTLLARMTRHDVSANCFKFRDVIQTPVGGVPAILVRLSFSGELGFEIYCKPEHLLRLSEAVEEAGRDLGLKWYGARALMSLRIEKQWGVWSRDYTPDFTAAEAGLDVFIDWNKDFVGKTAALAERRTGAKRRLVSFIVETDNIDVSNDEAILNGDEAVGYVTSGGYAHHVNHSMAMGYVPTDLAHAGQELTIEINGRRCPAVVQTAALYDANGGRMRS